ncbi:MAG: hypothetical protein KAH57_08185 [Thermoplasmata archaeon]|nr:hypothetical protein [Thermoplasmata archaeon]
MRYGQPIMIALISLLLTLVPSFSSISLEMESDPLKEASENDGPEVAIEEVELDLRNISGSFSLDLGISGSSGALTDHVNISLALYNKTGEFSGCLWIEPSEISLLGMMDISLLGTGDEGAWTEWEMAVNLSIPYDMELGSTLGLILPWLGIPTDQIPLQNLSIADLMGTFGSSGGAREPGEIMDLGSIVLVARAHDAEGGWYQDDRDITMEVMIAVLEFAISEGLIDDIGPGDDENPDEADSSEGEGKGDQTAEWVLLSAGAVLFIISLVGAVIFLALRRK